LFCARDHFGVKPFFYAEVRGYLVFGNTLNCIRLHPTVSDRLNDRAIGDFLLFGGNQDPAISAFADIQRLPAAHVLSWSAAGLRLHRYWKLPTDGDIRYRREAEYIEHFREVLGRAVEDRLRVDRVAIYMSGGLDSSAVAATARKLTARGPGLDLRAFTNVFDRLMPDEERHYTGIVGRALGIPISFLAADNYRLYQFQDQEMYLGPEPKNDPITPAYKNDMFPQIMAHARVALTGHGGDSAFYGSSVYAWNLLKNGRVGRLIVDLWRTLGRGWFPQIGLRTRLRRLLGNNEAPAYPIWLNKDFEASAGLRARWKEVNAPAPREHPNRPEAYASLTSPYWAAFFEAYDPAVNCSAFEVRHPFFDVRLLTYVLAIPPLPWCMNKELLRSALAGLVPETIRLRPKTFLFQTPIQALISRDDWGWLDGFESPPPLDRFVDRQLIPRLAGETDAERFMLNSWPYALNNWLRRVAPSRQFARHAHVNRSEQPTEPGCVVSG
jgi:asparagine synthase (glutamine-hydrolysing)